LLGSAGELDIRVTPNAKAGTLTIADTGIGMDRQELIDNLGTIARSGTRAFMNKLAESKTGSSKGANGGGGGLIGQFGVGFYSAFMVADRIEVISRKAGANEAFVWRSTGGAGFEITAASADDAARVPRGTEIVLHLKDDAKSYLEAHTIERIVRTYSDHILFPILLAGDGEAEDATEGPTEGPTEGNGKQDGEPRQINTASALWQRPRSELKPKDYTQAYRTIAGAFDEPAMTLHYRAEGRQSYAVMVFAPSSRPFDLYDPSRKGRIKLYVRRVFISDDADLMPPYLRFVRGVIDSEDLPLNLSREMLQNNPQVAQIRRSVTSRVLSELESLAEKDAEAFGKIWLAFGGVLKEGIYEDHERRAQLLALARFPSTRGTELRTLKQYLAELRPNQTEIYYLTGENLEQLKANPKLEAARARGIEVLLLADHVDAFWTSMPTESEGKPLRSLSQGEADLSLVPELDDAAMDGDKPEASVVDTSVIIAAVKAALGERVSDVRASKRLTDSASCLVAGTDGPDRELDRLLARQNRGIGAKPILELNMRHALVRTLSDTAATLGDADTVDLSLLLFEQAQILDGELPADPAAFTKRLNRLVARTFSPA
jgi:molecular chaperone HtpG